MKHDKCTFRVLENLIQVRTHVGIYQIKTKGLVTKAKENIKKISRSRGQFCSDRIVPGGDWLRQGELDVFICDSEVSIFSKNTQIIVANTIAQKILSPIQMKDLQFAYAHA